MDALKVAVLPGIVVASYRPLETFWLNVNGASRFGGILEAPPAFVITFLFAMAWGPGIALLRERPGARRSGIAAGVMVALVALVGAASMASDFGAAAVAVVWFVVAVVSVVAGAGIGSIAADPGNEAT